MKKLIPFLLLITLIFTNAYSANEQFRSIATGNWNSTGTWQMSTNGGGVWFAATSVPHDTSGAITIRIPNTVTVTVSTSANQLSIDSGGVLTINSGVVLTVPDGSGNEITVVNGSTLNGPGTVKTQGAGAALNLQAGSNFNAALNVNTGITYAYDQLSPYNGKLFGNVTVDAGATLNGGNASSRSLTIYGNVTNNGTVTVTSTGAWMSMKGASFINNGIVNHAGDIYFDSTSSLSGSGTFTPSQTIINGNITLQSNITYSPSSSITMMTGAVLNPNGNTFTLTSGSIYINSGATVSASGTFKTQNTVGIYARAGSVFNAPLNVNTGTTYSYSDISPYDGSLYGNINVDAGAILNGGNASSRSLTIYGNVTNNGTVTVSSTGAWMSMKGASFVNNGTVNHAGILYFDSTTSLSGSGFFTADGTVISGNITLLGNITYSPTSYLTMNSGSVLNPNGNTFTFTSGSMYINSGAVLSSSGIIKTQNIVGIYARAGSNFNTPLNVTTGTTYSYSDVSPYAGSLFGNVTVDAGATLNGGNISGRQLRIFGTLTNNGTVTASSSGGSLRLNGSIINNGVITTSGTLYMDSIRNISGGGTFTPSGTYISGNISLLSNITYSPSSFITILTGGTLNPNGNIFTLASGTLYIETGGTVSAPGTVKTQNDVSISPRTGSAFNAALNVNTGTTFAYDVNSPYVGRYYGNVTIDSGAAINAGAISGRQTYIYGNIINNGSITATSTGGTLRIKGSSLINNGTVNTSGTFFFDTTTSLSGTGSFLTHANLAGNANVTLNSTHQMSSVTINTGTSLNISNQRLKLSASNPVGQSGTFNTTGSTIEYNGTALQSVSVANISYNKLLINNTAGAILLGDISIPDTLKIILGKLNLNGRIITLTPTAYMTETPGNVVFGTTGYITTTRNLGSPSSLNVAGMGAVLTSAVNLGSTEVRRGHTVQTGLNGGTSIKRYYDITPTTNSGLNATLVFKYDDSELNLKPEPSLKLFKSTNSGTNWQFMGGNINIAANEITISGLSSFSRWSADSSGVSAAITMIMQGFYNQPSNSLRMSDTARAYLRNSFAPYAVVDSSIGIIDSLTFRSPFQFSNATNGSYYIVMKHRNSIETWSKNPVNYIVGNTLNYDFTFNINQAYGNNMILVGTKNCFYSGDVNQDGSIDLTDVTQIYNGSSTFLTGYVATDVNGDRIVDLTDISIAYNNSNAFVSVKRP